MNDESLWSGLALVSALNARVSGPVPAGVTGVSIDTRTLQPGDLFCAITGENSDGHDHVAAAFGKGAAAAVVDEVRADRLKGLGSLYVVRAVLPALENLGRAARTRSHAGIVAVTGSVGKTGTKEALRLVLSAHGATHASAASYNNHWGVPLTLARMPASTRFGVFEIGMNHAGEITPLVGMVRPHVAIVTTIAPVHMEYFGSLDAIADAKAEIFTGLEEHGVAIIHRDIAQFERLRAQARQSRATQVLGFGEDANAEARLLDVREDPAGGSIVDAWILGTELRYRIGAPGRHLAMNSLAVLLAARALGLDPEEAAAGLAGFEAPTGRGQRTQLHPAGGTAALIDESYNANPTSMRAALALLGSAQPGGNGRRIAVLGDMLELGPQSGDLHAGLAPDVAANDVDLVFAAGPMMKHLYEAIGPARRGAWAQASADIRAALLDAVRAGDVVMVKGSNGSRMAPLVAALKEKFAAPAGELEQAS